MMVGSHSPRSRGGFSLLELFVCLAIVALVVALILPATRSARPAARRTQCKSNLKQIGLALHNYHDQYGTFPPAYTVDADGRPLHSWRTLILPYLDHAVLYQKIDLSKPWDDPVNATACQTTLSAYACPESRSPSNRTNYLAVATPNSILRPESSQTIAQVKDGTSNTLLVIEVPHDQAVPWMSPQDADLGLILSLTSGSQSPHEKGCHALIADGAVRFLWQELSPQTLTALTTAAGGETIGEF